MRNSAAALPQRLERPAATRPQRIFWSYALSILLVHALAMLAFVPWFFSWSGLVAFVLGLYLFNTLGINLGYHRLLTHRGLTVPKWLEYSLATLGVCCLQDSPARWVAIHRMHHQHSDEEDDPHSPLSGFLWSHFGWLVVQSRNHDTVSHYERYAPELLRDPFYFWMERHFRWIWVYVAQLALYYCAGLASGWISSGDWFVGVQFGASLMIWGVLVRTAVAWHITWAVNSASHVWGYRNYETRDTSRNNWFVALVSNGEGWHNNHHAEQRSAAHGHRWWEFDVTYLTIRMLERLGIARDVVRPTSWRQDAIGELDAQIDAEAISAADPIEMEADPKTPTHHS